MKLAPCPWCNCNEKGSKPYFEEILDAVFCANQECSAVGPVNDPKGKKWNSVALLKAKMAHAIETEEPAAYIDAVKYMLKKQRERLNIKEKE